MNLQDFDSQLARARQLLSRQMYRMTLIRCVNHTALVVVVLAVLITAVNVLLSFWTDVRIHCFWTAATLLLILCCAAVYAVIKKRQSVERDAVIRQLDEISNAHNMIATACEFLDSARNSGFAQLAIEEGFETLMSVRLERLRRPYPPIRKMLLALACISLFVALSGGFSTGTDRSFARISSEADTAAAKADATAKQKKRNPVSLKTPVNPSIASTGSQRAAVTQASDRLTQVSAETNPCAGALARSAASQSRPDRRPENTGNKVSTSVKVNAARSGSGTTSLQQTFIQTDFLNIFAGFDEDQLKAAVKENPSEKKRANISKRPFADDRRAAPGRELGRSGRNGKPGNGRGGLGGVKKSRSTAALFPGEMITVHVSSQPGKGHSKSFESDAPMQSFSRVPDLQLAQNDAQEGGVRVPEISDLFKDITKQYFEELNEYANTRYQGSANAD